MINGYIKRTTNSIKYQVMNYPMYLTNWNRLSTTKKMVEDLFRLDTNSRISIIDNASTYPPLLEWYDQVKRDINIIRNTENKGCWTFFYSGHYSQCKEDYYIYSDADLELNPNMPTNWQEILMEWHMADALAPEADEGRRRLR